MGAGEAVAIALEEMEQQILEAVGKAGDAHRAAILILATAAAQVVVSSL